MRIPQSFAACCFMLVLPPVRSQPGSAPIYRNAAAPIANRVSDLLARMTLEEKVAQLESLMKFIAMSAQFPAFYERDHLNQPVVKQALGNGLGTLRSSMNSSA